MYYLDKNIETLDRIFDQHKREGYLRLDLNETANRVTQKYIDMCNYRYDDGDMLVYEADTGVLKAVMDVEYNYCKEQLFID